MKLYSTKLRLRRSRATGKPSGRRRSGETSHHEEIAMKRKNLGGTAWIAGCPCQPDCARRCAGCHAGCAEYLAYEKAAMEIREKRLVEVQSRTLSRSEVRKIWAARRVK